MLVKEIMSEVVRTVTPDMSLRETASAMKDSGSDFMPVIGDSGFTGTITGRDIAVKGLAEEVDCDLTYIETIMTGDPDWVPENGTVEESAKKMAALHLQKITVLDERGQVSGVLSVEDIAGKAGCELGCELLLSAYKRKPAIAG